MLIDSVWAAAPLTAALPYAGQRLVLLLREQLVHLCVHQSTLLVSGIGPYMLMDTTEFLYDLPSELVRLAKKLGVNTIEITVPPAIYSLAGHTLKSLLKSQDFECVYNDPHYVIQVDTVNLSSKLPSDQKHAVKRGHQVYTVEHNLAFLTQAEYNLITASRTDKSNYPPPPIEALQKQFYRVSAHYLKWLCYRQNELVGCLWAIKSNASTVQALYMATSAAGKNPSANLLLIEAMYAWAQQNQFSFLDLGTASSKGVVIEGLKAFKQSLTALPFDKYTLGLSIAKK